MRPGELQHLTAAEVRKREHRRRMIQLEFQDDVAWAVRMATRTRDDAFSRYVRDLEVREGFTRSVNWSDQP